MRDFLNRSTRAIAPYVAGEQPRDRRYIKLNTNENPYPPAPAVAEYLKNADAAELRLYPDPEAAALREAIAAARGVSPANVFCGNGSDEVLSLCFRAFFEPDGEDVAFPDVTYSFYPVFCDFYGIRYRTVPLGEGFRLDPADYEGLSGVQGVVFANPNAPTGRALSGGEVERILAANADKVVIVDEAYVDFFGQSAAGFLEKYPNLAVVQTFSKSHALAGMRCGYALAGRYLISGLERVRDCFNSYPLDRVCQGVCAVAAGETEYYRRAAQRVISVRERSREELLAAGFSVVPSESNFLFVRGKLPGRQLYLRLRDRGILVRHFDKPGISDYLRVTVGSPEDMRAFVLAIAEENR